MKKIKAPSLVDERGSLFEFSNIERNFKQVNVLQTKKGTVRGNHYHKNLKEKFFIISGLVDVYIKNIQTNESSNFCCLSNEYFVVQPYEFHTLRFIEDTTILSFYSNLFDPENPDIYRL